MDGGDANTGSDLTAEAASAAAIKVWLDERRELDILPLGFFSLFSSCLILVVVRVYSVWVV